jgi:serine/threonine protein phosphatase PrpC
MNAFQPGTLRVATQQGDSLKFLSVGRTHVGRVRTLNEDAYLNRPEIGLWAVADGMGGHDRGDLASQRVVEALESVTTSVSAHDAFTQVSDAIQRANDGLIGNVEEMSGATVVALLAHRNRFSCIWAGDSRAYLYRSGALKRLTRDHSFVQELVDAGALTDDQARRHPKANVVTRAVGAGPGLKLDDVSGELQSGDRLLLCSDGLSGMLAESVIADALRRAPLEWAAQTLVDRSLAAGGKDNVTVVVVAVE